MDTVLKALSAHNGNGLQYKNALISYAQLHLCVGELAKELSMLGVRQVNVAIVGKNSPLLIASILAVSLAGNTVVLPACGRPWRALVEDLEFCDVNWLICTDAEFTPPQDSGVLAGILRVSDEWGIVVVRDSRATRQRDNTEEVAFLLATSGSTGHPKWVMLTHRNIEATLLSSRGIASIVPGDRMLISLPIQFSTALTFQLFQGLLGGCLIVLLDRPVFLAPMVGMLFEQRAITVYSGAPTNFRLLLQHWQGGRYGFSSLRFVGVSGSTVGASELKAIETLFPNADVIQMYGLTECGPRVTAVSRTDIQRKRGSVGRPVPEVDISIEPTNSSLSEATRKEGEIRIKGENVMLGYYRSLEETERILSDGWLRSGDTGWIDEDGYLYLSGRMKNMIISGGVNICFEEVEAALLETTGIKEALVCGESDPILGEVLLAFVVASGGSLTREAIYSGLRLRLEQRKHPRTIFQLDHLEINERGKVRRDIDVALLTKLGRRLA